MRYCGISPASRMMVGAFVPDWLAKKIVSDYDDSTTEMHVRLKCDS